jgi:predicted nucleic acid-binding protein
MAKPQLTAFSQDLRSLKHVGLDSMCFIYHFAGRREYLPLTETLFGLVEKGDIQAVSSIISVIETLVAPEKQGRQLVAYEYEKSFRTLPNLTVAPIDWPQAKLAAKFRAIYPGLRTPDAIQIAACILTGAGGFLTNDKQFKQVNEIKTLILDDYL